MKKLLLLLLIVFTFGCTNKKDDYRIEKFIWLSYNYFNIGSKESNYKNEYPPNYVFRVIRYFEMTGKNKARISKGGVSHHTSFDSISVDDKLIALIDSTLYNKNYNEVYFHTDTDLCFCEGFSYSIIYKFKEQNEKTISYYCLHKIPPSLEILNDKLWKLMRADYNQPIDSFAYNVDLVKIKKDYDHYSPMPEFTQPVVEFVPPVVVDNNNK
jgi:hypothetical protein